MDDMTTAREWESSGMDDGALLEKFREWIQHARESGALHVSIPLPAAEQIFSHFEAWERRPEAPKPGIWERLRLWWESEYD